MDSDQGKDWVTGTLLRGADGALYFIPDENLEQYRVADKEMAAANAVVKAFGNDEHIFHESPKKLVAEVVKFRTAQAMCGGQETTSE
jgi:hypothetical protein